MLTIASLLPQPLPFPLLPPSPHYRLGREATGAAMGDGGCGRADLRMAATRGGAVPFHLVSM
jgi:hypothetical protein